MHLKLITLALALASTPSWALYKCVAAGKTSFQEQPCDGGQGQTIVTPKYAPEKMGAAPPAAPRPSIQEVASTLEQERLRNQAEYALRDKNAELARYRSKCDSEVKRIAANRFGFNDNLAGAARSQAEASAANAHAQNCDTQARVIESQVEDLRRQCVARACRPM